MDNNPTEKLKPIYYEPTLIHVAFGFGIIQLFQYRTLNKIIVPVNQSVAGRVSGLRHWILLSGLYNSHVYVDHTTLECLASAQEL